MLDEIKQQVVELVYEVKKRGRELRMKLSIVSLTVLLLDDPSGFGDPTRVWCAVTRELVYAMRDLWNCYRVGIYLYVSHFSHALTLKSGVLFLSKGVQRTLEVCTTCFTNVFAYKSQLEQGSTQFLGGCATSDPSSATLTLKST